MCNLEGLAENSDRLVSGAWLSGVGSIDVAPLCIRASGFARSRLYDSKYHCAKEGECRRASKVT